MNASGSAQTGKSIAIVGGGIAGLCAGCYAQMNGYRSRIYEMHDLPGGLMTAWERKGYTVDYCIPWLVGSAPETSMHELWREVVRGLTRPVLVLSSTSPRHEPGCSARVSMKSLKRARSAATTWFTAASM